MPRDLQLLALMMVLADQAEIPDGSGLPEFFTAIAILHPSESLPASIIEGCRRYVSGELRGDVVLVVVNELRRQVRDWKGAYEWN